MALESCSLESSGRLLESVSNCRSRWMVIVSQETQDPAYRATLLYFHHVTHEVVRDTRKILVEPFAGVRVNLPKFTGKIVVMRASLRAYFLVSPT